MQTIQLHVKDGYTQNILDMLNSVKDIMIDSIELTKDKNLELDPYFYERREELHQLRDDVKSGKVEMLTQEEYDADMDIFMKNLEQKYANN